MFVIIGTTTVDMFISGLDTMPRLNGDEFTTASLAYYDNPMTVTLGGNGANSAYVLASLDVPVALCSATGQDHLGDMVCGWLNDNNVDLRGFLRKENGTAITTAITDRCQDRLSFYYPGYFPQYTVDQIPKELLKNASVLLINGYALLPGLQNDDFVRLLSSAKQAGAITAMDVGPALGDPPTLAHLTALFPYLDYFIANDFEITNYIGLESPQVLLDAGARCVVIKRGVDGALILRGDEKIVVPGFALSAGVTIGAGDSFNAGFLCGIGQGLSLGEAARFGNATAALVLKGGKSVLGAPTRPQVETLINSTSGQ
jgi:sugar/nucleoside kinase (ribokinase family)